MELSVTVEGASTEAVLDVAYELYARWQRTRARTANGGAIAAVSPPVVWRGESGARAEVILLRPVRAERSVRDEVALVREHSSAVARGGSDVTLNVHPRTTTRRFYTGFTNGALRVCEPWVASAGVEVGLIENARAALLEAGWGSAEVGCLVPRSARDGTVGGQLSHEHHVPTLAFGPGQWADDSPESVAVQDLCDATFGSAVITRWLLDVACAGDLMASSS
jgi:hypothetical protein